MSGFNLKHNSKHSVNIFQLFQRKFRNKYMQWVVASTPKVYPDPVSGPRKPQSDWIVFAGVAHFHSHGWSPPRRVAGPVSAGALLFCSLCTSTGNWLFWKTIALFKLWADSFVLYGKSAKVFHLQRLAAELWKWSFRYILMFDPKRPCYFYLYSLAAL